MRAVPPALFALCLASIAGAQEAGPDPEVARIRANRTVDCLERVGRDLTTTMDLLRDASRQTQSIDQAAARDAAVAVVSLEQRVADLSRALSECVPEEAQLEPRTVVQEHTGAEAAVGEANDIPAVERDAVLTSNVRVVVGQRVDGTGTVADESIQRGIRAIGSRLERCYEQLIERDALQTGTLDLTFTVSTAGRVGDVLVSRSTLTDGRFQSCVRYAGRRIQPPTAARGGDARYTYSLRFGPS
ncbi:MAG: hypothetical protein CMN30_11875 [Sandaracinus sp.]|nr:hypothetical protein [Sandaracinus sp.]|tara:strand:- start:2902 stop:3633 length:732 start_codon:yes stop_codon:yes gene_type:complete